MHNFRLDVKDSKLIAELEQDSRQSASQIAKKIGLSKEVANYRLKKLMDSGFIKGFYAIIDYYRLGFTNYKLVINLVNLEKNIKSEIVAFIKEFPLVECESFIQSNHDLEINIWVKKDSDLNTFYEALLEKFLVYIKTTSFHLIMKIHFLKHDYIHKKRNAESLFSTDICTIDEDDYKILDFISDDPKIELKKLSQNLGMPITTVSSKLKRLNEKKILRRVIPLLNTNMLGYTTYKIDLYIKNPKEKNLLLNHLTQYPNITRVYEAIGPIDIGFEGHFKSSIDLDNFLTKLRLEIQNISDFEVMVKL